MENPFKLRREEEIVHALTVLAAVVEAYEQAPEGKGKDYRDMAYAQLEVLCWVLSDEGGDYFEKTLKKLKPHTDLINVCAITAEFLKRVRSASTN